MVLCCYSCLPLCGHAMQARLDVDDLPPPLRLTWKATFVGWGRLGVIRRLMFNDDDSPRALFLLLLERRCDLVASPATAAAACCRGSRVGPTPPPTNAPARVGWSRTRSQKQAQRQELKIAARPDTICGRAHFDLAVLPCVCCNARSSSGRR